MLWSKEMLEASFLPCEFFAEARHLFFGKREARLIAENNIANERRCAICFGGSMEIIVQYSLNLTWVFRHPSTKHLLLLYHAQPNLFLLRLQ
jgi:hypothetical protein